MIQWDYLRNEALPTLNAGSRNIEGHLHMSNFQKSYMVLNLESRFKTLKAKFQESDQTKRSQFLSTSW